MSEKAGFDLSSVNGGGSDDNGGVARTELSENVAEALVEYCRANMVHNEQQFLLMSFGYATGYLACSDHFVSGVAVGTAGSGKSRLQNIIEELPPESDLYRTTTGSDKSMIYDESWEDAQIASLDELQKPAQELIEFLKGVAGSEDEEFRYRVTGEGDGADRDVDEIVRTSKPLWFLYAQAGTDEDFEMWDRLLKIPVHESRAKNRGVGAMQFDWSEIVLEDADHEYIYPYEEGTAVLQQHFRELPRDEWVYIPRWVWPCVEPIFDHNRSESNRVYAMIANLIRGSALLNYRQREKREVTYSEHGTEEAYIVEPEDVANVLSCRQVLLSTTHQLDRKRQAICAAMQETGGTMDRATIDDIQSYIRDSDAPALKRPELERVLGDLIDNYFVEKHEHAAPDSNAHLYEFKGWTTIDVANVDEHADRFEGVVDPIRDQPFLESHREYRNSLMPTAGDFESNDAAVKSSGQQELGGTAVGDVELTAYQEGVLTAVRDALGGETFVDEEDVQLEHMVGVAPIGTDPAVVDRTGTVIDPDHDIWTDVDGKPDDWVDSESRAATEATNALQYCFDVDLLVKREHDDGTFEFEVRGGVR